MDIRPIRNKQDHDAAVAEVERLWGAPEGSPDGDKLDVLATLIDAYEDDCWPAEADPVDILHFAMEDMGRSQAELGEILGSRPRASEVLNRRRALTVDMIDRISRAWGIPREVLARPYPLARPDTPTKKAAEKGSSKAGRKSSSRTARSDRGSSPRARGRPTGRQA
jgi:HTH-type transcriptional regulator / antitoxin HigA